MEDRRHPFKPQDLNKLHQRLSALSDLKLMPLRMQGDEMRRRKDEPIKDEGEDIIYEHFCSLFRKKRSSDRQTISNCLKKHFTFSYLDQSLRQALVQKFCFCRLEEGEYLMRQGDPASCFFLLHQGRISVEIDGAVKRRLQPQDGGFGQLALLFGAPRSASLRADVPCFLWYIDRPTFKAALKEVATARFAENRATIDTSPLLGQLSTEQRAALADVAVNQCLAKGNRLYRQGEAANTIFLVQSGKLKKVKGGISVGWVSAGMILGEEAALQSNPIRMQTIICEQPSHLLALSLTAIGSTLGRSLPVVLIRNQLKVQLMKESFYSKLASQYSLKILDSFRIISLDSGRTIIDCYKKQRNAITLILQGQVEVVFPKLISGKSSQRILASIEELKNTNCKNFDRRQLLGAEVLRRAATNEKMEDYYELNIQLNTRGKIAVTSLAEIEQTLGCTLSQAIKRSIKEKEERKLRTSRVQQHRDETKNYQLNQLSARKVLGSGAFGKVLLVTHEDGKHFALKCISKKSIAKPRQVAMVQQEKQTLFLLSLREYPFFLKYYRSFKDEYYLYFLTEHIEGRDLFDVIRTIGILSPEQARFYTACLLLALENLHSEGLLYRDLKPQNIMVGRDGYLKLVDMGTAKRLQQNQNRTFTFIGTPQYMAPQVFLHRGYAYPADLWSLGALLYELLAGKNPFVEIDTDDMKEIYDQIITSPLQFPHFMRDTAHPLMRPAKNLIAQLLDKEVPAHRLGGSFSQLRAHPFFSGFDWDSLQRRTMNPAHIIAKQYLIGEDKIRQLPSRSILTYLKDWNSETPKIKGLPQDWDQIFAL